jgi:hypothetical protein
LIKQVPTQQALEQAVNQSKQALTQRAMFRQAVNQASTDSTSNIS